MEFNNCLYGIHLLIALCELHLTACDAKRLWQTRPWVILALAGASTGLVASGVAWGYVGPVQLWAGVMAASLAGYAVLLGVGLVHWVRVGKEAVGLP